MATLLFACGKKENNGDICGTWKVDYIEYEGSKFSVDEWKNMENEDLSEFYIILKDGGKAYIYDDGYGNLVDWLKSDNSIMIDGTKCSITGGKICLDYYGTNVCLKKTTANQEIPKDEDKEESNISDLSDENAEWEEFLDDYEEWVDEYIVLVKKYKENPTDGSIVSDYTEMLSEINEWTEKADEIKLELEGTDEATDFSVRLLKIVGKLSEIAN